MLILALATPIFGHDLWLEREDGGLTLFYGHKHSGHEKAMLLPYNPAWAGETLCVDTTAKPIDTVATPARKADEEIRTSNLDVEPAGER